MAGDAETMMRSTHKTLPSLSSDLPVQLMAYSLDEHTVSNKNKYRPDLKTTAKEKEHYISSRPFLHPSPRDNPFYTSSGENPFGRMNPYSRSSHLPQLVPKAFKV